ncbi:hypothetical protein [Celeribacter baekdonensis]|uniref:hypothetical protein n=1 Tax=Celeribacter baekdonensis TaxID=875171 RepID=UPI00115F8C52|nr:hypothetical protein [Celeribacter baekdonensis]
MDRSFDLLLRVTIASFAIDVMAMSSRTLQFQCRRFGLVFMGLIRATGRVIFPFLSSGGEGMRR